MLWFGNPSSPKVREAMRAGLIGCIDTPNQGNRPVFGATWCGDNSVFGDNYPGDDRWWAWLTARARHEPERCAFAVAPDVVGDAAATIARSVPWLARIHGLGIPAAIVAQDGQESLPVPWDAFDVLFVGGSTGWKLGRHARRLAGEARRRGKRVHMGRVNTLRRYRYADAIGCHTADGTTLARGPDVNLAEVLSWQREPTTPLFPMPDMEALA